MEDEKQELIRLFQQMSDEEQATMIEAAREMLAAQECDMQTEKDTHAG